MKRLILVTGIIAGFLSCSSDQSIPPGILSPVQMKGIIWDLIKAGELAKYDTLQHKNIRLKDTATLLFEKVFALHGVEKQQFYKSYRYYLAHPDQNKALFDSVSAMANKESNRWYMKQHALPESKLKKIPLK
jgi:hypothetical protein